MARAGSVWVNGNYLYYIDESGYKWRAIGTALGQIPVAKPGSLWVDGEYIYYIDEAKNKRRCPRSIIRSTTGVPGSAWVEGSYVHFLNASRQKTRVHEDWDDWDDNAHSDTPHYDYTADVHRYWDDDPHSDSPWDNWDDYTQNPVRV
ncbi:MAG: hypothetical protein ACM309_09350 [Bacillota bacterium]